MLNDPLPRLDRHPKLCAALLPYCRLKPGEIWRDPLEKHRVGCLDATDFDAVKELTNGEHETLAIHDPPYNLVAFQRKGASEFAKWCRLWVENSAHVMAKNAALYVWMGADQNDGFQPLPEFMLMMRGTPFRARSLITMRNQRGFGTQKNWMAVRQELLYYARGKPMFNVSAEYTDIPKILRGYYKDVGGRATENLERGKSENIRAGNVWVDVQQVFYRMEENVSGCYAQKPLKSALRIVAASSSPGDAVLDFFAHSGSTLLACEMLGRRCFTADIDPVFCEIAIRRLEHFRTNGKKGWQNSNAFAAEIARDKKLRRLSKPAE